MSEYQPYQGGAFQPPEHVPGPVKPLRVPAWIAMIAVGLAGLTTLITAAVAGVGYLTAAGTYSTSTTETVAGVLGALGGVLLIVPGIAFIVWLHRARTNLESAAHPPLRWSRGWTIGAWFIPIANLVLPLLVINEIDAVSEQRANEAEGRPAEPRQHGVFVAWAILWTVYVIQDRLALGLGSEDLATVALGLAAASIVEVAAAVSAILLILRITINQDRIQNARLGPTYLRTATEPGVVLDRESRYSGRSRGGARRESGHRPFFLPSSGSTPR